MEKHTTLQQKIFFAISVHTIYSSSTIKVIYDNLQSYDNTIKLLNVADKIKRCPVELSIIYKSMSTELNELLKPEFKDCNIFKTFIQIITLK